MIGDFGTILNLVGPLDDTPGDGTSRERFRSYLATGLTELGAVRDAVQTCITSPFSVQLVDARVHEMSALRRMSGMTNWRSRPFA